MKKTKQLDYAFTQDLAKRFAEQIVRTANSQNDPVLQRKTLSELAFMCGDVNVADKELQCFMRTFASITEDELATYSHYTGSPPSRS